MLRLDINLSSKPFINQRKFFLSLTLLLGLLTLSLMWNVSRYQFIRQHQKVANGKYQEGQQRMALLQKEEDLIRTRLRGADTADFLDQIQYVNGLIEQRIFSWTELLNDLERVTPPNVQIASIRPRIIGEEISVEIVANARGNQDAIEFVSNLEKSGRFFNVHPVYEDIAKVPGMTGKQITIDVSYGKDLGPGSGQSLGGP
jgi:Tfp pilus assembly protein PilN